MPRSEVREILSPALSGPSCVLPRLGHHGTAAWEIEHYESNVESFSGERATAATALWAVKLASRRRSNYGPLTAALMACATVQCHGLPPLMSFWFPRARP